MEFQTISIVTPSLNQGYFIERTVRSVLDQDVPGLEYIVIDGGSTDETLGILKRYKGCLYWVSERDQGQADAVNKGIRSTKGDIIGWLNSDDLYCPGALPSVLSFFEGHPAVDIVYGDAYFIDRDDRTIEPYPTEPWSLERLKSFCFLCQPAVFFRRQVVDGFGLLDRRFKFCLDYEYWLRLALRGVRFAYLPRVLACSRLYPETKTLGLRLRMQREVNDMLVERLGLVPDQWLLNYGRVFFNRKGIRRLDGGRVDAALEVTPNHISRKRRFQTLFLSALRAPAIAAISLIASLRWNRKISLNLFRIVANWARGHSRILLKKVFYRQGVVRG